jgi:hypothetical protein
MKRRDDAGDPPHEFQQAPNHATGALVGQARSANRPESPRLVPQHLTPAHDHAKPVLDREEMLHHPSIHKVDRNPAVDGPDLISLVEPLELQLNGREQSEERSATLIGPDRSDGDWKAVRRYVRRRASKASVLLAFQKRKPEHGDRSICHSSREDVVYSNIHRMDPARPARNPAIRSASRDVRALFIQLYPTFGWTVRNSRPSSPRSTSIDSPSRISPDRSFMARASWTSRWRSRFSGRAPYAGS